MRVRGSKVSIVGSRVEVGDSTRRPLAHEVARQPKAPACAVVKAKRARVRARCGIIPHISASSLARCVRKTSSDRNVCAHACERCWRLHSIHRTTQPIALPLCATSCARVFPVTPSATPPCRTQPHRDHNVAFDWPNMRIGASPTAALYSHILLKCNVKRAGNRRPR